MIAHRKKPGPAPRTDEPVKVAVYLPKQMARALKADAALSGLTVTRLVESLVREHLARGRRKK